MKYLLVVLFMFLVSCGNLGDNTSNNTSNNSMQSLPIMLNGSYIYSYQDTTNTGRIVKCYAYAGSISCVNITDYQ